MPYTIHLIPSLHRCIVISRTSLVKTCCILDSIRWSWCFLLLRTSQNSWIHFSIRIRFLGSCVTRNEKSGINYLGVAPEKPYALDHSPYTPLHRFSLVESYTLVMVLSMRLAFIVPLALLSIRIRFLGSYVTRNGKSGN